MSQQERDRFYIAELERLIQSHGIEIPETLVQAHLVPKKPGEQQAERLMKDGSLSSLANTLNRYQDINAAHEIYVQFRNLTFYNNVPKKTIPTVGSALRNIFMGSGPKHRVNIFKDLTGRIQSKTMTLLMGPPGCGECGTCAHCIS